MNESKLSEKSSYRAVLAEPAAETGALLRLWADNLNMSADPSAALDWQYVDGPMAPGQMFLLRAPMPDGQAVGCAGITTRELWSDRRPVRAAHLANFAIDREHRTALPALTLQRAVIQHVEATFDAGLGFANRSAFPIYLRVGYHALGPMVRYVRVLRHGDYFSRYLEEHFDNVSPRLTRHAGTAVDLGRLAIAYARAVAPMIECSLTWLAEVDARFDRLWETHQATFGIASRRDAAFLRWRFLRKPEAQYRIAALVDRVSEQLRAYAVVRAEPCGMAEIADAFGNLAALDGLFARLVPELFHRGHTAIGFRFIGDPRIRALLAVHGFKPREVVRLAVVHASASCHIAPGTFCDPDAWYLTELDADT
ncbi:MAG: hypothetical protein JWO36_7355 [Myxococcales bacterium]|nr:hypothetical protein [Myxococcales bacterium]